MMEFKRHLIREVGVACCPGRVLQCCRTGRATGRLCFCKKDETLRLELIDSKTNCQVNQPMKSLSLVVILAVLVLPQIGAGQQVPSGCQHDGRTSAYTRIIPGPVRRRHNNSIRQQGLQTICRSDSQRRLPHCAGVSFASRAGHLQMLVIATQWSRRRDEDGAAVRLPDEECDAVRDWVRGGRCFLLIADHAPLAPLPRAWPSVWS